VAQKPNLSMTRESKKPKSDLRVSKTTFAPIPNEEKRKILFSVFDLLLSEGIQTNKETKK